MADVLLPKYVLIDSEENKIIVASQNQAPIRKFIEEEWTSYIADALVSKALDEFGTLKDLSEENKALKKKVEEMEEWHLSKEATNAK